MSPLQAIRAHGGCGCKDPHIHSHGNRKRQGGQSYARPPLPPVLILQEVGWIPGPVWSRRSEEKSPPLRHTGSNPGRPARSQAPSIMKTIQCNLAQLSILFVPQRIWRSIVQLSLTFCVLWAYDDTKPLQLQNRRFGNKEIRVKKCQQQLHECWQFSNNLFEVNECL